MSDLITRLESDLLDAAGRLHREGAPAQAPLPANAPHAGCEPSRRRPRVPIGLALGGALGIASLAGVLAALVGLGATTQRAFAGWTPSPTLAVSDQTDAAQAACLAALPPVLHGRPEEWHVELADTRGPFTLLMLDSADHEAEASCFFEPSWSSPAIGIAGFGAPPAPPPADQAQVSMFGMTTTPPTAANSAGQPYTQVEGRVGPEVSGVTLQLDDGTKVEATVGNGRLLAWWPGTHVAVTMEVTSPRGTQIQQMPYRPHLDGALHAHHGGRVGDRVNDRPRIVRPVQAPR